MELITVGINYYPGRKVFLYYNENEDFITNINNPERFKFICVEEGKAIFKINGKSEILFAPFIMCLNESDQVTLEKNDGLKGRTLYFHPALLNSVLNYQNIRTSAELTLTEIQDCAILKPFIMRHESHSGVTSIGMLALQKCIQYIERIHRELSEQDNDFWPCNTRAYFYQFLIEIGFLFESPAGEKSTNTDLENDEVNQIIFYLHTYYHKKITIQDITSAFHLNRNNLREKFYKVTGTSVIAYLSKLRIQKAALLLKDTDLLVAEISEQVGFADITNFGRLFKKYIGCNASTYRNRVD